MHVHKKKKEMHVYKTKESVMERVEHTRYAGTEKKYCVSYKKCVKKKRQPSKVLSRENIFFTYLIIKKRETK